VFYSNRALKSYSNLEILGGRQFVQKSRLRNSRLFYDNASRERAARLGGVFVAAAVILDCCFSE
jgi:hypothetical protein